MASARAFTLAALVIGAAIGRADAPVHAQTMGEPIRLSAWAVRMANVATEPVRLTKVKVEKS